MVVVYEYTHSGTRILRCRTFAYNLDVSSWTHVATMECGTICGCPRAKCLLTNTTPSPPSGRSQFKHQGSNHPSVGKIRVGERNPCAKRAISFPSTIMGSGAASISLPSTIMGSTMGGCRRRPELHQRRQEVINGISQGLVITGISVLTGPLGFQSTVAHPIPPLWKQVL